MSKTRSKQLTKSQTKRIAAQIVHRHKPKPLLTNRESLLLNVLLTAIVIALLTL